MVQRIRRSLLLTVTVLITVGLAATLFAVLRAANSEIEDRVQGDLAVAARVFERLLADRNEQLASHSSLLAQDSRFTRAIAKHAITRNDQDIVRLLLTHQQSIAADLSVLVDTRGRVTSNAPPEMLPEATLRGLESGELNRLEVLTVVGDTPYQLVFSPIKTPNWVAWVGMGFEIDADLLQTLENITGMHASLFSQKEDAASVGFISTLPDSLTEMLASTGNHLPATAEAFVRALEDRDWLSLRYRLLETPEAQLLLLLSTSVENDLIAYEALRGQLLALGVLILILAIAVAVWFSGRANHSIRSLALAAQRIGHGDYSKNLALASSKQMTSLEKAFNKMQVAIEERERHFSFQAQHDQLTGVPNRLHFDHWVEAKLASTEQPGPCALALLQICGLSQLIDIYGPDVTNRLIQAAANRAKSLVGPNDKLARFESDQFIMYLENATENDVTHLCKRMVAAFQSPLSVGDVEVKLEARFGMAFCPQHGTEYPDLLRRTNIALSQTFVRKTLFEVYEAGQDALHLRKIQITHSLQNAVDNDEFEVLFQPQFSIEAQSVVRAEALLRWHDKTLGAIPPDEFIPLAEHSGHIVRITGWLVDRVIEQLARWKNEGVKIGVSINVSAQDLTKDAFVDHLIEAITKRDIDKSLVVLEVTETAMIEHPRQVIKNLQRLHDFGVSVAMDDFGTGFSSLSQLKSLPIHELKIDKAFILNLDKDRDDQKIVHAAIEMAHNLDLLVVAEGVENLSSLTLLESMGCDMIQGNYLSKPMSAQELESWLASLDPESFVNGGRAHSSGGKY